MIVGNRDQFAAMLRAIEHPVWVNRPAPNGQHVCGKSVRRCGQAEARPVADIVRIRGRCYRLSARHAHRARSSMVRAGLFNACYSPLYERLMAGSRAAAHRASAILVTPLARAMLSA